jgi:hypothetical protein
MHLVDYRITRFQFARDRVIGDSQVRADDGVVGLSFAQTLLPPMPSLPEIERMFEAEVWPDWARPDLLSREALGAAPHNPRLSGGMKRA